MADDEATRGLVAYVEKLVHSPDELTAPQKHEVWREQLNGRWVVFLRYAERTYVLMPLLWTTD